MKYKPAKLGFNNSLPYFSFLNKEIMLPYKRRNWFSACLLMHKVKSSQSSWLFDIFIINCADVLPNGLKLRWIWQEMKQIRLALCFRHCRSAALFPFDWSIKSALPLSKTGPITESNFGSQAVCPALSATRNSLLTSLCRSQAERKRERERESW